MERRSIIMGDLSPSIRREKMLAGLSSVNVFLPNFSAAKLFACWNRPGPTIFFADFSCFKRLSKDF